VECLDSASQITPHKHSHTWTKLLWLLLALFCFFCFGVVIMF
jgi:hypothetical protein